MCVCVRVCALWIVFMDKILCFTIFLIFFTCFQPGKIGNPWGPVVDGQLVGINSAFLPDPPLDMRRQSRMKQVKILAGQNLDDGAYFIRKFKKNQTRKCSIECLFIFDTDTLCAHFRGNPLCQATERHLNNR